MGASAKSSLRATRAPRLPGRYRVRRHIASGGMASVWCAEDRVLGRSVAVKVLAERFAHDEDAVRRFKREARTAARVSGHPHVVTIFDVGDIEPREGEAGDGGAPACRAFMVMEYLSGGTVADAMRVATVERDEAIRWLDQAASALDHAHKRGIVHRDIKPANFLLDSGRVLYVADFGIARLQSEDTITSSGELFGTAAYLSPEQALGGEATGASDRYSLAVAAFELLAGRRPFQATHFAAQARQHVEEEVPPASEIAPSLPPAVDDVLIRGMAKQPQERYESAGAFVDALEDALQQPVTQRTLPLHERAFAAELAAVGAAAVAAADDVDDLAPSADRRGGRPPRGPGNGPEPTWSPIQPASTPPRPSRRVAALAALAAVLVGVAALALLGGHSGSRPTARIASQGAAKSSTTKSAASHHRHRAAHKTHSTSSSTTSAAAAPSTTASAPSTTTATTSADALQAQGHQELASGSYSQAISTLRQAVDTASPSSLTYAYALYDLGRALTLGGNPQAAIPVLEQRLRIPNQSPVVQQALNQARRAAGQATAGATAPSSNSSTSTTGSRSRTTSSASPPPAPPKPKRAHRGDGHDGGLSGGVGLPPGQAKHGGDHGD